MNVEMFQKLVSKILDNPNHISNCALNENLSETADIQSYYFEYKELSLEIRTFIHFDEDSEVLRESLTLLVFPKQTQGSSNPYKHASVLSSERLATKPHEYQYKNEDEYKRLENLFELIKGKAHGTESEVLKALDD
jgi:hypothetical protein